MSTSANTASEPIEFRSLPSHRFPWGAFWVSPGVAVLSCHHWFRDRVSAVTYAKQQWKHYAIAHFI